MVQIVHITTVDRYGQNLHNKTLSWYYIYDVVKSLTFSCRVKCTPIYYRADHVYQKNVLLLPPSN